MHMLQAKQKKKKKHTEEGFICDNTNKFNHFSNQKTPHLHKELRFYLEKNHII